MSVFLLSDKLIFPPPALAERDGLLAVGGDLRHERLLLAYRMGIFPWFTDGEPILWWSPDPRLVLYPSELKVSRSLKRLMRKRTFQVSMDTAFEAVIDECIAVRADVMDETWITDEMRSAYCRLHDLGYAHSVEVWFDKDLVGGLYGVSLGRCFFGESMFTRISNASKVALVALTRYLAASGFTIIDCQVKTDHLIRFGARLIPREEFLREIDRAVELPIIRGRWTFAENC